MQAGTLTRIRLFRADHALDVAIAEAVEREGSPSASAWIRRAINAALRNSDRKTDFDSSRSLSRE